MAKNEGKITGAAGYAKAKVTEEKQDERFLATTMKVGTSMTILTSNIDDLCEIHNIKLPTVMRYNIKLKNNDNIGCNKIIELADTPDIIYALSLSKGKEAMFAINRSNINYISVFSLEYSNSYYAKKAE